MKILVTNDDGWQAPGINALTEAMKTIGEVRVVAPDRNCSAASNSLTLAYPIRVKEQSPGVYSVQGTPVDCVYVALNGLFDWQPDIVVSGINSGPNMGDDVLYSGTVAAAMEGRFHGYPAFAFSLAGHTERYEAAATVAANMVRRFVADPLAGDSLLNINIPAGPFESITGAVATRLGLRGREKKLVEQDDPRGERIFWIGPVSKPVDNKEGTDFHAIANQQVSVTSLSVDLTHHSRSTELSDWLVRGAA